MYILLIINTSDIKITVLPYISFNKIANFLLIYSV